MPDLPGSGLPDKKTIMEGIRNNEGCRVHGVYKTWKLMGVIQINTDGGFVLAQIATEDMNLFNKVHLRHYFNELSFGTKDDMLQIQKEFADYPEHTVFDPTKVKARQIEQ